MQLPIDDLRLPCSAGDETGGEARRPGGENNGRSGGSAGVVHVSCGLKQKDAMHEQDEEDTGGFKC